MKERGLFFHPPRCCVLDLRIKATFSVHEHGYQIPENWHNWFFTFRFSLLCNTSATYNTFINNCICIIKYYLCGFINRSFCNIRSLLNPLMFCEVQPICIYFKKYLLGLLLLYIANHLHHCIVLFLCILWCGQVACVISACCQCSVLWYVNYLIVYLSCLVALPPDLTDEGCVTANIMSI